jgi:8-oxo-dGTP pyrophosphatase MutT (NUDIX family)
VTLHQDALTVLSAWSAPSTTQSDLQTRFVDHLRTHTDGLSRACLPAHITASTVVLSSDHSQVLLTLHAKAKLWFQFGGHCEPDDRTLAGAAEREAREESGLPSFTLDPVPVQLSAHEVPFCHPDGIVDHLDVRFVAVAPYVDPAVSDESIDVRWFPVGRLPTQERSMRELVDLARERQSAV